MTKTWLSTAHFLQFFENSLPPNSQCALNSVAVGLSLPDKFVQIKKASTYLSTWPQNNLKFIQCQDSSSPFSTISAKTGYSQTTDIYTGPVENIVLTGPFAAKFSTSYSQSLQPNQSIPSSDTSSSLSYQKAFVPNSVNKALFIANHKKALLGLPYRGQFHVRDPPRTLAIHINDHNFIHPTFGQGMNKHARQ